MWTLYYAPNTCALATHMALEEAGAEFELRRIDFSRTEQQSEQFLKINPKARVPALVTSRGVLTETPAMLAFVAQSFPGSGLAPMGDPFAFAELQAFNSYLCSTVHVAHAHRMRGYRWASHPDSFLDMQRKVPESVGACFRLIEQTMLKGPWVMGDVYTIADAYLFTLAQWLEADGVDLLSIPRVADHRRRVADRVATQRAIEAEQAA
jgi:glutathione S-transferase